MTRPARRRYTFAMRDLVRGIGQSVAARPMIRSEIREQRRPMGWGLEAFHHQQGAVRSCLPGLFERGVFSRVVPLL